MSGKLSHLSIFILMVLVGFLVVLQGKALSMGAKHILLNDIRTIQNNIMSETKQRDILEAEYRELTEKVHHYETNGSAAVDVFEMLQAEIAHFKMLSGLVPLEGQGVIIIIDDGQRELIVEEDPNNVLVHDTDIRSIVDDLKNAGAEAISINDERYVLGHSRIFCNGPTITINGKQYAQPFIIRAIGDRKHLEAAINAPESYGSALRQWGVFIEVNTTVSLKIPAYSGKLNYQYSESKENE